MSPKELWARQALSILDHKSKIQCYVRVNELGEDEYSEFKKLDIGDIIGVTGEVFTTKKGRLA